MLRLFRASALAVVVAGCSSPPAVPIDAGPLPDGATVETRRLELETERSLTLRSGDEAVIGVRYVDERGRPVVGETLRFVLEGVAHDSTLAGLSDRTDAEGRASARLLAGATAAAFRVRVSAEAATAVSIDVAVSDAGFGDLEVTLDYAGEREDGLLAASVFTGARCEEMRTREERGDRYRLRGPDDDEVAFVGLPADLDYAVVGRLEGSAGLLAWGCVDGVEVSPERPTRVEIDVLDLPAVIDGEYDVTLTLEVPASAEATGEELRAFGAAFLAPDPTTTLLDAMERQLSASGDVDGLDALTVAREGDLDARYAGVLDGAEVGPAVALEAVAGLVSDRLARLELGGRWTNVEGEASVRLTGLRAGTDDVTEASLGAAFALTGTGSIDERGVIVGLRIAMPLDRIVAHVLTSEASLLGLTRREELVVSFAACDALPALPGVDACDDSCRELACREVTTVLWAGLDLQLSAITPSRTTLAIEGSVELVESMGGTAIEAFSGTLAGSWGSSVAVSPEPVDVHIDATRVIP